MNKNINIYKYLSILCFIIIFFSLQGMPIYNFLNSPAGVKFINISGDQEGWGTLLLLFITGLVIFILGIIFGILAYFKSKKKVI